MNNFMKAFILIFWSFGNLVLLSVAIYIKWTLSGNSFDTYLLLGCMIIWVIGQIMYAKPEFVKEKKARR